MRTVNLEVRLPTIDVHKAFDRISDFAQYPLMCEVVRHVTVHPRTPDGAEHSDWEVYFRNGILRWSEMDTPDRDSLKISFEQTDGDFAYFAGSWTIRHEPGGSSVSFGADFDFGIPSLAGILDPIAERVFRETIARVLCGLFGQIEVVGNDALNEVFALGSDELAVSGAM